MTSGKRVRGFTLVEAIIVITLAAAVLTFSLMSVTSLSKTQQRDQRIEKMAQEMAMIERAMTEYMTGSILTAIPNRTRTQVTIPQLIAANQLPADFANRDGAVGTSPFGQPYRIHVFRITGTLATGENPLTWAITEVNGPLASHMARAGIDDTDDGVLGVKQAVAGALANQHRLISGVIRPQSGVIRPGAIEVTGDFIGFTQNVSFLLPAGPTTTQRSWVAVLHGFADLSAGTGTPTGPFSGDCRIIEATRGCAIAGMGGTVNCKNAAATWTAPQCSTLGAGWVQADTISTCPPVGQAAFRVTPVGNLSYASTRYTANNYATVGQPVCNSACAGAYPCTTSSALASGVEWINYGEVQDLRINDTSVANLLCSTDTAYNGAYGPYGLVCGYGRGDIPWANPTILSSNPRHILCCKPN